MCLLLSILFPPCRPLSFLSIPAAVVFSWISLSRDSMRKSILFFLRDKIVINICIVWRDGRIIIFTVWQREYSFFFVPVVFRNMFYAFYMIILFILLFFVCWRDKKYYSVDILKYLRTFWLNFNLWIIMEFFCCRTHRIYWMRMRGISWFGASLFWIMCIFFITCVSL